MPGVDEPASPVDVPERGAAGGELEDVVAELGAAAPIGARVEATLGAQAVTIASNPADAKIDQICCTSGLRTFSPATAVYG
jgi:hypothetical protein